MTRVQVLSGNKCFFFDPSGRHLVGTASQFKNSPHAKQVGGLQTGMLNDTANLLLIHCDLIEAWVMQGSIRCQLRTRLNPIYRYICIPLQHPSPPLPLTFSRASRSSLHEVHPFSIFRTVRSCHSSTTPTPS